MLLLSVLVISTAASVASNVMTLKPKLYNTFAPGVVKPAGWALNQANIQANGLAGQEAEWYSYVAATTWTGGTVEYSEMHESSPYWFNGVVSLAYQLDDDRLKGQAKWYLDYILYHQQVDGWIGPEPYNASATIPRLVWPRYLVLWGLIQYAEADPTQTDRIVSSMHRFVVLAYDIWSTNQYGTPDMGFQFGYQYVRWQEFVYSLQWLYDNYPQGQELQLLDLMQMVKASGFDWKNDWYNSLFPTAGVPPASQNMSTHGVNTAESLKSEALSWRFTDDESDIQSTWDRIGMIWKYHGRPSGIFAADEHLAGLGPSRGTELCDVVEAMFSLETIYQILGNNTIADMAEKIAYNALPATIMPDWMSHQYLQQDNQIWSKNNSDNIFPWWSDSSYSNVFGLEPNYPCCTVNHPQGYPKFWGSSFLSSPDGGMLFHALLGPATFSGTLADGNSVNVTVDTIYPFGSTLKYTILTSKPLTFGVRVPGWAQSGSTVAYNSESPQALQADASTSLHTVQLGAGQSTLDVSFEMQIEIEPRTNGSIAVHRGPLYYAIDLSHNETTTLAWRTPQALSYVETLPNVPEEYLTPYDVHTQDHLLLPTSPWNLAIDPSTIHVIDTSAETTSLPYMVWNRGAQPVSMTAMACEINWEVQYGAAAWPPPSPNACLGDTFNVTLRPFGGTKLRIGEIPLMKV